ncbi:MAG: serine/threonine-protein kinase, partial [Planctomycetota bacterium]
MPDPGPMKRLESLFGRALDLPEAERQAFADRACASDGDLRERLLAMLAADAAEGAFLLDRPAVGGEQAVDRLGQGDRIGAYRILEEIGAGGMGTVYLAEIEATGSADAKHVALKVLHPHLVRRPDHVERFLREARAGRQVDHPNVVRSHDADTAEIGGTKVPFLAMDHVEGQTLRSLLRELDRVPEELGRHIGCEVAKGLAAIHAAGIVHRDLKPENVLITPEHRAPEQFGPANAEADGRTDLYALGLVLYELLTGRHPFAGDDVRHVLERQLKERPRAAGAVNPQLSPFVEAVLETLLEKQVDQRFASARELLAVLEAGEDSGWWHERSRAIRAATRRPLRRIRVPRETALYGRDEELEKLQRLYTEAKAGEGRVVLVEGEAGIGKTRLVDEFVGRLREEGEDLNFLFGSYPPGGAATAQGAFATAYREHFGAEDLEATVAPYLSVTPVLVPAFA